MTSQQSKANSKAPTNSLLCCSKMNHDISAIHDSLGQLSPPSHWVG